MLTKSGEQSNRPADIVSYTIQRNFVYAANI
jgi:hypothetical protein